MSPCCPQMPPNVPPLSPDVPSVPPPPVTPCPPPACRGHGGCVQLAPDARLNPHRSVLGTGNYDVNVIMAALQSLGLAAVWWDKRRSLERLVLGQIVGFILNVPSHVSLGFVALPLRRKHWLAVRQLGGTYYNLDSKLRAPARIGGEAELRAFLQDFLAQGLCEVFLVVPRAVEEAGAWLSPE
uniref:Josephin-2 n=1 Tax=Cairina moschata TaxID=8855 RepID=A0A8C3CBA0_CAIMO